MQVLWLQQGRNGRMERIHDDLEGKSQKLVHFDTIFMKY